MTQTEQEQAEVQPVKISDEATRVLADKVREWSGWPTARLVFGKPEGGPFAHCDHEQRTFVANPERLVLNPHRVLLTVTPFRLRQEAVLTGALLHEASHARHSHWQPGRYGNPMQLVHSDDGEPVTRQALALARLMEEPRIEGIMAHEADNVGALGLGWTMRASAAHCVPTTVLHTTDSGQQLMDVVTSWALRAGRQIALVHHLGRRGYTNLGGYRLPNWVGDFNNLLHTVVLAHLESLGGLGAHTNTSKVIDLLTHMVQAGTDADKGTFMVDMARDILDILFPETDGDDESAPMPGEGCTIEVGTPDEDADEEGEDDGPTMPVAAEPEPETEADEDTESGEGEDDGESGVSEEPDTEDEGDEGEGDAAGEGDTDEADEADESDESEGDEAGSGGDSGTEEGDESDAAGGEDEDEPESDLQEALREMEQAAKDQTEDEAEDESSAPPPQEGSGGAGAGGSGVDSTGYRIPTAAEREVQRGAERFLRSLVSPSESSKVVLTESPSATVDGAALAAWKAGGMDRDPHFFKRTRRTVEPTPPVKIAVLVDVSGSMDELQAPSALLSWALSAAAIDLRNFAGRGSQIESCLIHWGSSARVIQHTGDPVPGIKEFDCIEGTYALADAHDLVAQELPGFFDPAPDGRPVNRLLVNFTDWELSGFGGRKDDVGRQVRQALAVGVNMLSVVPRDYSERNAYLPHILAKCDIQRGTSTLMRYNPDHPEQVWDTASKALG